MQQTHAVADPGFPIRGRRPRRGAPTPEAATFRKICMSKRKNLDPWGGASGAPLDPPMPCSDNMNLFSVCLNESS